MSDEGRNSNANIFFFSQSCNNNNNNNNNTKKKNKIIYWAISSLLLGFVLSYASPNIVRQTEEKQMGAMKQISSGVIQSISLILLNLGYL